MSKPFSGTATANAAGASLPASGVLVSGVWISVPSGGTSVEVIADGSSTGALVATGSAQFFPCENLSHVTVKRVGVSDQEVRYWGY